MGGMLDFLIDAIGGPRTVGASAVPTADSWVELDVSSVVTTAVLPEARQFEFYREGVLRRLLPTVPQPKSVFRAGMLYLVTVDAKAWDNVNKFDAIHLVRLDVSSYPSLPNLGGNFIDLVFGANSMGTPPDPPNPRLLTIASISSTHTTHGRLRRAKPNSSRTTRSASPT